MKKVDYTVAIGFLLSNCFVEVKLILNVVVPTTRSRGLNTLVI